MENHVDDIKAILRKLRSSISEEISKKLNLDKSERVIEKLGPLSSSCEECQEQLLELKDSSVQLEANADRIGDSEIKHHKQLITGIISHLQKKHQFVTEGFYLGLYMSIGISLGVVFGLTIFDNIGLGIPIGMSIGIAIGVGLDADAKKKGKTI
ncbi:hypothetical protein V7112_13000 [Bacillus sp. JJ1566]|uniref:hypothetical protein n=1 Tax=Bacillus sp. JJ1566 TaxID=3122961 RepID=UPI003000402B